MRRAFARCLPAPSAFETAGRAAYRVAIATAAPAIAVALVRFAIRIRLAARQEAPRAGGDECPAEVARHQHDEHRDGQFEPREHADVAQVDERRQQRQVEHHDLRVAERHQEARHEHPPRRACARQRRAGGVGRRAPHLPGKEQKIARARELQHDEQAVERMRDHCEPRDRAAEPHRFPDPHREQERQHVAHAVGEHARDERGDARAGRAGGDEQGEGEYGKRGQRHGGLVCGAFDTYEDSIIVMPVPACLLPTP